MFFEKSIRLLTVAKAQLFVNQLLTAVCKIAIQRCSRTGRRSAGTENGPFWAIFGSQTPTFGYRAMYYRDCSPKEARAGSYAECHRSEVGLVP